MRLLTVVAGKQQIGTARSSNEIYQYIRSMELYMYIGLLIEHKTVARVREVALSLLFDALSLYYITVYTACVEYAKFKLSF